MTTMKPAIRLAKLIRYAKGRKNKAKAVHAWCVAVKYCLRKD